MQVLFETFETKSKKPIQLLYVKYSFYLSKLNIIPMFVKIGFEYV